jgi:PST family polysaccharide transporter
MRLKKPWLYLKLFFKKMTDIIKRIKNWRNIHFVKDAVVMQAGSIFSTAINIVASIAFARILMPERYGVYALVYAFAGLIALFTSFGVDNATLILLSEACAKKDRKEIKNIITYFVKVTFLISLFVGGLAIVIAPALAMRLYGSAEIGHLVRIVILINIVSWFSVFVNVLFQVLIQIKNSVIFQNLGELFKVTASVVLAFLGYGVLGLLLGRLIAFFLIAIVSIFIYKLYFRKNSLFPSLREIVLNWKEVKLKRYFKFGFLIAVNSNVASLYSILPVMFLGMFFSPENVGYFNIAFRYITLPLILISPVSALLNVRFPKMNVEDKSKLRRNFLKVSVVSGMISTGLTLVAVLLASLLIKTFYGEAYSASVNVVYYLAIFPIFSGFAVGLGPIIRTLDKIKEVIFINIALIAIGIVPSFYLIKNYGLPGVSIVVVMFTFLASLSVYFYVRKILKQ